MIFTIQCRINMYQNGVETGYPSPAAPRPPVHLYTSCFRHTSIWNVPGWESSAQLKAHSLRTRRPRRAVLPAAPAGVPRLGQASTWSETPLPLLPAQRAGAKCPEPVSQLNHRCIFTRTRLRRRRPRLGSLGSGVGLHFAAGQNEESHRGPVPLPPAAPQPSPHL